MESSLTEVSLKIESDLQSYGNVNIINIEKYRDGYIVDTNIGKFLYNEFGDLIIESKEVREKYDRNGTVKPIVSS